MITRRRLKAVRGISNPLCEKFQPVSGPFSSEWRTRGARLTGLLITLGAMIYFPDLCAVIAEYNQI